jgi:3-deoxy-D-manno-octulosonate 8-phosphate phosphatase (KDO 8-P phosphatase)
MTAPPKPPMASPKVFILDVDGVMTTGHFVYSRAGKVYKVFGPDDADGLALVRPHLEVRFLSGDKRGFGITSKRIKVDMGYPLDLVSTVRRLEWIDKRYPLARVIYMGDGLLDATVVQAVGYGICPANGSPVCKEAANFVTVRSGGDRAVAEACLHILERFYEPYDPSAALKAKTFGLWTA